MKKMFKKAIASALTAITALSAIIAMPVSASADEATTFTEVTYKFECTEFVGDDTITLEAQGSSWTACEKVSYDVKGTGTFELKAVWPAAESSFKNLGYLASANSVANIYKLTSIVINDTEFTFQADATAMDGDVCKDAVYQTSTINAADGNMNGFPNIWNKAGQQAVVAKAASGATINGGTEDITIDWEGSEGETPAPTEAPEIGAFDPKGEYNAYIGLQTPKYSFRNAWDEEKYGKATDFFNQITGWDAENKEETRTGTITDTVIKGNGTYSVKVEGLGDWVAGEFADQDYFNLLFVSTDIPLEDPSKVTISDVKLIIDGQVKHTDAEGFLDTDPGVNYVKILVQNIWNADKKEISYYPIPKNSVEIQFTIDGFDYDNEDGIQETEAKEYTTRAKETEEDEKGGNKTILIVVVVVVAVVVVAAIAIVLGKKKETK